MADYYTYFSLEVPLNETQKQWAMEHCEGIGKALEEAEDSFVSECPHDFFDPDEMQQVRFDMKSTGRGIWIHTEGGDGCVEDVAEFLRDLITHFDLPPVGFAFSLDCSKPRLDAYGGGAVWVTKEGAEWMNTMQWLEEKERGVSGL